MKRPRMKKAIGYCSHKYHNGDLLWADIHKERCLEKKCDYFSWISLAARDEWRKEHGYEIRPDRIRTGTPQERKVHRRKVNLTYLENNNIKWAWIDERCDHILIDGRIDYFPGSTRWYDRDSGEFGYKMLYQLFK